LCSFSWNSSCRFLIIILCFIFYVDILSNQHSNQIKAWETVLVFIFLLNCRNWHVMELVINCWLIPLKKKIVQKKVVLWIFFLILELLLKMEVLCFAWLFYGFYCINTRDYTNCFVFFLKDFITIKFWIVGMLFIN
jgi:hypothetical protein